MRERERNRAEVRESRKSESSPKDQKSRSKCKICGIEGRNDKIRKHIKEAHFAKAKADLPEPPKGIFTSQTFLEQDYQIFII